MWLVVSTSSNDGLVIANFLLFSFSFIHKEASQSSKCPLNRLWNKKYLFRRSANPFHWLGRIINLCIIIRKPTSLNYFRQDLRTIN